MHRAAVAGTPLLTPSPCVCCCCSTAAQSTLAGVGLPASPRPLHSHLHSYLRGEGPGQAGGSKKVRKCRQSPAALLLGAGGPRGCPPQPPMHARAHPFQSCAACGVDGVKVDVQGMVAHAGAADRRVLRAALLLAAAEPPGTRLSPACPPTHPCAPGRHRHRGGRPRAGRRLPRLFRRRRRRPLPRQRRHQLHVWQHGCARAGGRAGIDVCAMQGRQEGRGPRSSVRLTHPCLCLPAPVFTNPPHSSHPLTYPPSLPLPRTPTHPPCCTTENLYHMRDTNLARISDDFYVRRPARLS